MVEAITVGDLTPVQLLGIVVLGVTMARIAEFAIFREKYQTNGERFMAVAGVIALLVVPSLLAITAL